MVLMDHELDDGVLEFCRERPGFFFERILGWEAWGKQLEVAEAVRDGIEGKGPRWIAVRAGNGVGKTALAARVMLWALRCFEEAIVVTTAPTVRQVDELLWREARTAYKGSRIRLGGKFYEGESYWKLGARQFAIGISPQRDEPEKLQGFHAPPYPATPSSPRSPSYAPVSPGPTPSPTRSGRSVYYWDGIVPAPTPALFPIRRACQCRPHRLQ